MECRAGDRQRRLVHHRVRRGGDEQPGSQCGSCTTVAVDTSCVISKLTPGLDYTVRVRARNAFGDGPDSPRRTAVPLAAEGARLFVAPGGLRATFDHANQSVLVFWNAIPDDEGRSDVTGYVVQAVAEGPGGS